MSSDASAAAPVDSAAVFRRSWGVYRKFVTHNWMRHREVYEVLRRVVQRPRLRPLSIADFGCGDAACTIAALNGVPLRRFVAVDRVGPLLESARQALASRGCLVDLVEASLSDAAAAAPPERVDVVLAAYSLHHLSLADKERWLADVRRWLAPGGRLLLIDLALQCGETRRRYLDRFHRHAADRFGAFAVDERAIVRDHMEACDFPESLATWSRLSIGTGWTTPRLAYRDPERFFAALVCGSE